jgi:hypothetical protein
MKKLTAVIAIVLVLMSCKTSSHKCDAYGAKEKIVRNVLSV